MADHALSYREPNELTVGHLPGSELPRYICVTIPPAPFKVAKVTCESYADLRGIVNEGVLTWVNFTADDLEKEAPEVGHRFGFSEPLVRKLVENAYELVEDNETELGIVMPAVQIHDLDVDVYPIIILIRNNLILTLHDRNVSRLVQYSRYAENWINKLPAVMPTSDKLTMMLSRLLQVNNTRNFDQLRLIEEKADDISEALLDPTIHHMETGRYVYEVKHSLINYLNAMWRSLDLLNNLRYGDAELITDNPKVLQRLSYQADEVTKHIGLTEHTSDVLVSGTTVLQTLYNNQLLIINNRLLLATTWMTIIGTAVLVPNTLATIFGFVFTAPAEDLWWTLGSIIVGTVLSTIFAYRWVTSRMHVERYMDDKSPQFG